MWQQKDWPEFYYDSGVLLPHISSVSRLIGALSAICQTLSNTERLDAQERILADDQDRGFQLNQPALWPLDPTCSKRIPIKTKKP
ncbi:MAG TPA: DUF4172 domain-containing protein [Desulfobulbus sp.]|nr:DUF4172 domain-containing protein [Desulfobulbus sp.]